jgi:hypothetical protein
MAAGIAALIHARQFECCRRQIDIAGKWRVVRGEIRSKEQGLVGITMGMIPRNRIQIEMPR